MVPAFRTAHVQGKTRWLIGIGQRLKRILVALAVFALGSCDGGDGNYQPAFGGREQGAQEYTFAVYPGNNPQLLYETYSPLLEHLEQVLGDVRFRFVASRDYASFEARLRAREFDFVLANPYQSVLADGRGYRILGKMADDENFRGIIVVRRDSGIDRVEDLVGRTIAYPAPTALAASMMPQYFLHRQGLPLNRTHTRYVGSQDASIESVHFRLSDAAATWPPAWAAYSARKPEARAALRVRWQTEALVNNGVLVRNGVPQSLGDRLAAALFSLHASASGRRLLRQIGTTGFEPAGSDDYQPVLSFLRRFEAEVRRPDYGGQIPEPRLR